MLPALRTRRRMVMPTHRVQRMHHPMETQTLRGLQTHRRMEMQKHLALRTHRPMATRMRAAMQTGRSMEMLSHDSLATVHDRVRPARLATVCCPRRRIRPR